MRASDRIVGTMERILYLKSLPPIEGLSTAELSLVASYMRERFFRAGETLLREGEAVGAIHFVVQGAVVVRRRGRALGTSGPGSPVGGLELMARDTDGIEAVAQSDTLTLELDADAVLEVFEDHFSILHHVLRDFCRQLLAQLVRAPQHPAARMPRIMRPPRVTRELDLVERIFFLRQAAPFERSSINALAELSRGLMEVRFEPEIELWKEGDPAPGILLIVDGTVRCASPARGTVFTAGPGAPLGALEAVGEVPRWYDAVTQTKVVGLHGSIEGLFDVFEDNFEMALDYLAVLAQSVLRMIDASAPQEPAQDAAAGAALSFDVST